MSTTMAGHEIADGKRHAPMTPAGPVRVSPNGALAIIGFFGVGVIGLWWQDTQFIYGWGSWLTNAGRLTGLLAGYAIAVLLALMARVPALERGVGSDRLARWHAMGGRYVVSLAVAHTLLIIWGYAVTAHAGLIHQTSSLLTTYPDVLMATVALGLLVVVGIVSARAARRRLRYETWHFIHLYTYIAVALMFSHQFSTGADFVSSLQNRVLWSAMYIGVGVALFWYRFVVPVVNLGRHVMRVEGVVPEAPGIVSVYIRGRDLHRLRAESGQFFRWRFLTRDLWYAANPYSLSAAPGSDRMRITVKIAGEHSAALGKLKPGTRVLAEGPYGSFTASRRTRRKVLLIGAGVGITPLRALFETIPGNPGDLTLLYRASTVDDLVLQAELNEIARIRGAQVHYLLSRPEPDRRRRGRQVRHDPLSADRLRLLIPDIERHEVYLCGPDALTASLRKTLRTLGVPARHIHHESFTF